MHKETNLSSYQKTYTLYLLRYRKATNDQLNKILQIANQYPNLIIKELNLSCKEKDRDLLNQATINQQLSRLSDANAIVMGDAFWPTGQHITKWCKDHKVKCILLQHGQWIYYKDKSDIKYVPDMFCLFGDKIIKTCLSWSIANKTKFVATGNPKYDGLEQCQYNDTIYFSPPVIEEIVHAKPNGKFNQQNFNQVKEISEIKEVELVIHPHYREARIEQLKRMFPKSLFIDPSANPLVHIVKSKSVLCSRDSTLILDALACNRIPIVMDYNTSYTRTFPKGFFGKCVVESDSIQDLHYNLKQASTIQASKEEIKQHIYLENASSRVLDSVLDILRKTND